MTHFMMLFFSKNLLLGDAGADVEDVGSCSCLMFLTVMLGVEAMTETLLTGVDDDEGLELVLIRGGGDTTQIPEDIN